MPHHPELLMRQVRNAAPGQRVASEQLREAVLCGRIGCRGELRFSPSPSRMNQEVLAFGCRRASPQGANKSLLGSGHATGLQNKPLQRLGPVRGLALLPGSTQRLAFRAGDRNRVFFRALYSARGTGARSILSGFLHGSLEMCTAASTRRRSCERREMHNLSSRLHTPPLVRSVVPGHPDLDDSSCFPDRPFRPRSWRRRLRRRRKCRGAENSSHHNFIVAAALPSVFHRPQHPGPELQQRVPAWRRRDPPVENVARAGHHDLILDELRRGIRHRDRPTEANLFESAHRRAGGRALLTCRSLGARDAPRTKEDTAHRSSPLRWQRPLFASGDGRFGGQSLEVLPRPAAAVSPRYGA